MTDLSKKISPNTGLNNPHDKFFRHLFSDQAKVINYLKGALSEDLLGYLDLGSLRQNPDSFVDDELKTQYADIVYDCISNDS